MNDKFELFSVNKVFLETMGYEDRENTNLTLLDICPYIIMEQAQNRLALIKKMGKLTFRSKFKKKNGEIFPVEVNAVVFQTNGQDDILVFASDLSEQLDTPNKTVRQKELCQFLLETCPDGVAVFVEDKLLFANRAALEMMEVSCLTQALGNSMYDFIHPDFHPAVKLAGLANQAVNNRSNILNLKLLGQKGKITPIEGIGVHFNYEGKSALMVVGRDVSGRAATKK